MKLTIDRTKWLRGEGGEESFLLRGSDKKMCCLGFYGLACGISENMLLNNRNPYALKKAGVEFPQHSEWLFQNLPSGGYVSTDCGRLMEINDSLANEWEISEIFARNGVEVEFIN